MVKQGQNTFADISLNDSEFDLSAQQVDIIPKIKPSLLLPLRRQISDIVNWYPMIIISFQL